MDRSTVHSWLDHAGVIDSRRSLEIPYRLEQYAALMWNLMERDTTQTGDRLTMLDGGRYPFPHVTFIGPAGETRFDAGASWDELGGAQAVRPATSVEQPSEPAPSIQILQAAEEDNWQERFLPVIDIEDESPRFSPLFRMAYGGSADEVNEFIEVVGSEDSDEENEEFGMEEYDLDDLEE